MGVAHLMGRVAGDQIVEVLIGQNRDLRVEQRHVNVLALAGLFGVAKRRLYRDHGVEAREDVRDGNANLLRLATRLPRDRHQAGHALNNEIVAGSWGVGSVLPKTRYRAIDQLRIDLAKALVIKAIFLQPTQLEVLDQNVSACDELADGLSTFLGRKIDRDGALAAVSRMIVGGGQVLAIGSLHEGRSPFSGVVAAVRVFHLDDVGSQIGQQLACPRTCKDPRKFDYPYARKWRLRHETVTPILCQRSNRRWR